MTTFNQFIQAPILDKKIRKNKQTNKQTDKTKKQINKTKKQTNKKG